VTTEPLERAFTVACAGAGRGRERRGAKGLGRRARNERRWAGLLPHYVAASTATV
jgi:hypothetical protein